MQTDKIDALIEKAITNLQELWLSHIIFTWQWWLGVAMTVMPWVVWFLVRKKDSTGRLLYAGLLTIVVSSYLDVLGISLGLWTYYYHVIPFIPTFIPWDFSLLPVATMLFIQYKPKLSPYIKAVTFSAFSSFIFQPFNVWLGLYDPKEWKHYYSFPILVIIYLMAHFLSRRSRFKRIEPQE